MSAAGGAGRVFSVERERQVGGRAADLEAEIR